MNRSNQRFERRTGVPVDWDQNPIVGARKPHWPVALTWAGILFGLPGAVVWLSWALLR